MATPRDPDVSRLLEVLQLLAELLADHSQHLWAEWVQEASVEIRRGERQGFQHLLRAYGGMGSLNDVQLDAGPARGDDEALSPSETFRALSSEAYRLARRLDDG